jgi:hypothetical protein
MSNERNNRHSRMGRSLELSNGDLQLVGGDLATVAGQDNFLQAMQVMIETPLGTDIFNVSYGFDLAGIISQPQGLRLTKELIRLNIVKSLSRDDRIREISEVVFDDDPRFFELAPQANAERARLSHKANRQWQAIVVVQTITEGEVAVTLEGTGI